MLEAEQSSAVFRNQLHRYLSLRALGCCGKPGEFNKPGALQAQEPSVMRMPLAFELGFKEEGRFDFGPHRDRAGRGKPAIKLLCPGAEKHIRSGLHHALEGKGKRPLG